MFVNSLDFYKYNKHRYSLYCCTNTNCPFLEFDRALPHHCLISFLIFSPPTPKFSNWSPFFTFPQQNVYIGLYAIYSKAWFMTVLCAYVCVCVCVWVSLDILFSYSCTLQSLCRPAHTARRHDDLPSLLSSNSRCSVARVYLGHLKSLWTPNHTVSVQHPPPLPWAFAAIEGRLQIDEVMWHQIPLRRSQVVYKFSHSGVCVCVCVFVCVFATQGSLRFSTHYTQSLYNILKLHKANSNRVT